MLGQLPNLATSHVRKAKINKEIEPHVDIYDIDSTDKRRVMLPIEIISYSLLGLLVLGFGISLIFDGNTFSLITVTIIGLIAPFYLPYMYFFLKYLKKDEHTEIEVDRKHGLIKYFNSVTGENLLFHQSQIENCVIHQSILLPLNIDYITLYLKGGKKVCFSSLVIDLKEFVTKNTLPYQTKEKLFNPIPRSV